MMASIPPLLTAADFSAGTNGVISPDDPRLGPLLDGASAAVRRYCGWHVTPVISEDVLLDGTGSSLIIVPTLRLVSVSSASNDGVTVDQTGFDWSPAGLVKLRSGCWSNRYRSVALSISHGFESAPDVVQIVQQVVANAISSSMGATREQAGQVSISWSLTAPNVAGGVSLLQRDLDVLNLYRLPRWL